MTKDDLIELARKDVLDKYEQEFKDMVADCFVRIQEAEGQRDREKRKLHALVSAYTPPQLCSGPI